MKRISILLSCLSVCAAIASAQDLKQATEMAQKANEALIGNNFEEAVAGFAEALSQAGQCTEEGKDELVSTCRKGLVGAQWGKANQMVKDGQLKEALAQLAETAKTADEYCESEILEKANAMKIQLYQAIANASIKAAAAEKDVAAKKDKFLEAVENLDLFLEANPQDGGALLQKGQVMSALGKQETAIECFIKAKEFGEEVAANKQLSTIFVKQASAKLKAKDFSGAIEAALKSNEYLENANAYKIAGVAANSSKDLKKAFEFLSKYLEFKPNDAQIKQAVEAIKAQLK